MRFCNTALNLLVACSYVFFSSASDTDTLTGHVHESAGNPLQVADVKIVLYETESRYPTSLQVFLDTAKAAKLSTHVVGRNNEYIGFGSKYTQIRATIVSIETEYPDALVILLDARDVLFNVANDISLSKESFQPRLDNFINGYMELTSTSPGAIVVSAEPQCCVAALSHAHPAAYFDVKTGMRAQRACSSGEEGCVYDENENMKQWIESMDNAANRHLNAYLNAGMMVGTPSKLVELIDRVGLQEYEDDQAVLSGLYLQFPNSIVLDHEQKLFGNTAWPVGLDDGCYYDLDWEKDGTPSLAHSGYHTVPLIIHTSGKFYECLDYLSEKLGLPNDQRFMNLEVENVIGNNNNSKSSRKRGMSRKTPVKGNHEGVEFQATVNRRLKGENYKTPKASGKRNLMRRLKGENYKTPKASGKRNLLRKLRLFA